MDDAVDTFDDDVETLEWKTKGQRLKIRAVSHGRLPFLTIAASDIGHDIMEKKKFLPHGSRSAYSCSDPSAL